jgi:outer membrane protein OmpA-like peptidoglycan-associated protein
MWVGDENPSTLHFAKDEQMYLNRVLMVAAVLITASGCATRSYVDENVARLETRLDEQSDRINKLTETSRQALERATEAGVLAQGKFLYTVVLTDDGITFETDESALTDAAQSKLGGLAGDLKADNRNVYLEIQGHTDSTGPAEYNQKLGWQRAESVRRYLYTQGVSLGRMATISYGEDAPAEPNSTPEGRAKNRRVEIVVLN